MVATAVVLVAVVVVPIVVIVGVCVEEKERRGKCVRGMGEGSL